MSLGLGLAEWTIIAIKESCAKFFSLELGVSQFVEFDYVIYSGSSSGIRKGIIAVVVDISGDWDGEAAKPVELVEGRLESRGRAPIGHVLLLCSGGKVDGPGDIQLDGTLSGSNHRVYNNLRSDCAVEVDPIHLIGLEISVVVGIGDLYWHFKEVRPRVPDMIGL